MALARRLSVFFVGFLFLAGFLQEALARPKIGLVLSGGGARGMAHIGVLKVLEELRVPVDAIAATSMGAIVGGAYATGLSPAEMERIIGQLDWKDLFTDRPSREFLSNRSKQDERDKYALSLGLKGGELLLPQGAISGQKLDLFLRDLTKRAHRIADFNQLPIPFRAVATDLTSGEMIVFEQGRLETAMRSSMSIPGVIAPAEVDARLLVDGGLVRNLPIDIVRQMGVDLVIAVNLGTPLLERAALNSAIGITVQMIAILTEQNVQASIESLGAQDVLILPELGDITAADFARGAEAIRIGVEAAQAQAEQLRRFSLSVADYAVWRKRFEQVMQPQTPLVIDEIRLEGLSRVNPETLTALMETRRGQVLNETTLEADIARLYGRGDFERINYRVLEEQGRQVLVIDAFEKSWGPNYLRFGLGFNSDFQGNNAFDFFSSYQRTWVNSFGAAWQTDLRLGEERRLSSEFYQPLNPAGPWFVAPYFEIDDRLLDIFEGDQIIAEFDFTTLRTGIDLGLDLDASGEFRVGVVYNRIRGEPEIGAADLPSGRESQTGLRLRYRYDQLDNLNFPSAGSAWAADALITGKVLGGDTDYTRLQLNGLQTFRVGNGVLASGLVLGARLGNERIPVYDEFTLGGFLKLSGYQAQELRGQYVGLARLVYYQSIGQLGGALGGDIYLGGSVEIGNTWDSRRAIQLDDLHPAGSVFVGADTLLGPLYLAFGLSDKDHYALYLYLGRP